MKTQIFQKIRKSRGIVCVVILAISIVFSGTSSLTEASSSASEVPSLITVTAYDVGSVGYTLSGFTAEGIMKKYGTKIRVIPAGNDVSRLLPVRLGDADFSFMGIAAMMQFRGMEDFATMEWGPQDLRSIFLTQNLTGNCVYTRADTGIETPWDLKGKKAAYVVGAPALNLIIESLLAYANLTWDDVVKVNFPSYAASAKGVFDGTVDFAQFGCLTSHALKLEAGRSGARPLHFPNTTPEDKKAWARLQKVAPYLFPYSPPVPVCGWREPEKKKLINQGSNYPYQICYASQDDDLIYFWVKALHQTYDLWKDASPWFVNWTMERNFDSFMKLDVSSTIPYHPGAIRYFKEIGVWTAEYEAKNNETLKRVKKLKALWKATVDDALEKGIKGKDFPDFWTKKRIAAGL